MRTEGRKEGREGKGEGKEGKGRREGGREEGGRKRARASASKQALENKHSLTTPSTQALGH